MAAHRRTRREILSFLAKAGVLSLTVSACTEPPSSILASLSDGAVLDKDALSFLGEIVDAIIPATATGGARDAGAHLYIRSMLRTWYRPDEVLEFRLGLEAFSDSVGIATGRSFLELDATGRQREVRMAMSGSDEAIARFISSVREMTIIGYYTSRLGATVELRYAPIPGRYEPCSDFGLDDRAWSV